MREVWCGAASAHPLKLNVVWNGSEMNKSSKLLHKSSFNETWRWLSHTRLSHKYNSGADNHTRNRNETMMSAQKGRRIRTGEVSDGRVGVLGHCDEKSCDKMRINGQNIEMWSLAAISKIWSNLNAKVMGSDSDSIKFEYPSPSIESNAGSKWSQII